MYDEKGMGVVGQFKSMVNHYRSFSLFDFSERHPQYYLVLTSAFALVGYVFLLAFPIMVIVGLIEIVEIVNRNSVENNYANSLYWLALVTLCTGMTYQIISIKFSLPKGIVIPKEKIPCLAELIDEKARGLCSPKIQHIVVTDKYELDIVKLPIIGIPFWSSNCLVIGFSLMQSLPKGYFDSATERKLNQYSLSIHLVINWLSSLRKIWCLYPIAFKERNRIGDGLIYWFFHFYASLYSDFSIFIKHKHELHGDVAALANVNDVDLLKTIESQIIVELYLKQYYWPSLVKLVQKNQNVVGNFHPYARLPAALKKDLDSEKIHMWLKKLYSASAKVDSEMPSLCRRMDNIGHLQVKLPNLHHSNAAEYYFESKYAVMVGLMNKQWLALVNKQRPCTQINPQSISPLLKPSLNPIN